MKKAFIWGPLNFPHGSASANYVQHLADALIDLGYYVVVLSDINHDEIMKSIDWASLHKNQIELQDILIRKRNKWVKYFDYNFMFSKRLIERFKQLEKKPEDILISYTHDGLLSLAMNQIARKAGMKTYACVVEMFPKKEYGFWPLSLNYWKEAINYKYAFKKYDCVFPISTFIKEYLDKKHIRSLCIPCMANPYEYGQEKRTRYAKRKFIYPAMGKMKDSLSAILGAFNYLTIDEIQKMEFHITGLKEKKVKEYIKNWDEVKNSIVIHKWMEYEELIDLYRHCDFMLLARDVNQMTLANFPSKVPEVMCFGVVPIVSRVGDYTKFYLVDKVNSIVVDGCSGKLFAKAISEAINLTDNEVEKLSSDAMKCAKEKFWYKNWEDSLKKVIEG